VPDGPVDFATDLRNGRRWPDPAHSLWRSPTLVGLTSGRLSHLVAEVLPAAPAQLPDVGCGTGALSLEVAQDTVGIHLDAAVWITHTIRTT